MNEYSLFVSKKFTNKQSDTRLCRLVIDYFSHNSVGVQSTHKVFENFYFV